MSQFRSGLVVGWSVLAMAGLAAWTASGVGAAVGNKPAPESRLEALAIVETGHRRFAGDDLEQAIRQGDQAVVAAFLDAGADVNWGWKGRTAVHIAAEDNKCLNVLGVLLNRGGDPGRPDQDGVTPLMEAVIRGHVPVLEALLGKAGPEAVARRDKWGQTALKRALSNVEGRTAVVRLLLAAGADPVSGGCNMIDLEWAWEIRCPDCLELEITVLVRDPRSAGALLGTAILYDRMEFAAALQAAGVSAAGLDRRARLFLAAAMDDAATLGEALADGDLLSIEDARHETLLSRAARRARGDVVLLLLGELNRRQAGRSQSPQPTWNCPALLAAAEGDGAQVVQNLLAAGADPDTHDFQGCRPLHHAARLGRQAAVTILLAHGADPNAATNMGATPLWCAARSGEVRLVQVLLTAGAEADRPGEAGATLLLAAVEAGCSALDWANSLRSRQLINVLFQEEIFPNTGMERGNFRILRSTGR